MLRRGGGGQAVRHPQQFQRRCVDDAGFATVELALATPVVAAVAALLAGVIASTTAQATAAVAARDAARMLARGDSYSSVEAAVRGHTPGLADVIITAERDAGGVAIRVAGRPQGVTGAVAHLIPQVSATVWVAGQ